MIMAPDDWTSELEAKFQEYLADFDPSPQNYGDDYGYPPDRFEFFEMVEYGEV